MDFLSKTFGSISQKVAGIPYNLGNKIVDTDSSQIWSMYEGVKRDDGAKCSVFEFDLRSPRNSNLIPLAKNAMRKLKTIRFPGVIQILDTFENDSYIYISTEPVKPLTRYLAESKPDKEGLLFGIYMITNSIAFINKEASSFHGNLSESTVFVNESGEWKLSGFEILTNPSAKDLDYTVLRSATSLPNFINRCSPEVKNEGLSILKAPYHYSLDSWQLAIFIYEVFSGTAFQSIGDLSKASKVPKSIILYLRRLSQTSVKNRASPIQLLNQAERPGGLFDTDLINFHKELNELRIKGEEERAVLLDSLLQIKDDIPPGYITNKVLPELIHLLEFADGGVNALRYILLFGDIIEIEEFKQRVLPSLVKAYSKTDRAIRVELLTALPKYAEYLTKSEVNDKIYPAIVPGFSDTVSLVREETVKAILYIAPNLSHRNINNDLLRYLAKAQVDSQPEIRTNTTVCLGKIAEYLDKDARVGVLITAFSKGMKDTFIPTRVAAMTAFMHCVQYFPPEACCSRALGAVSPNLLDKNKQIREYASKTVDVILEKIHTAAEELPDEIDETESPNFDLFNSSGNVWADKTIGGLVKSIAGQLEPSTSNASTVSSRSGTPGGISVNTSKPQPSKSFSTPILPTKPTTSGTGKKTTGMKLGKKKPIPTFFDDLDDGADDGWGEDFKDYDDEPIKPISRGKVVNSHGMSGFGSTSQHKPTIAGKKIALNKKKIETFSDDEDEEEDGWGNDDW